MFKGKRLFLSIGASLLLFAGIVTATAELWNRPDPVTVPDETLIHVTLDQGLSSDQNRAGDRFEATVSKPIVIDNKIIIPEGAHATGTVVDARPSGRLMGRAHLQLALEDIEINGKTYQLRTSSTQRIGQNHKKRNWAWIGGGGAGGALIGAAAAGGKGALIGGPIGLGAGTAAAYFTGKKDIRLSPETPLTFRLAEPVTIDAKG